MIVLEDFVLHLAIQKQNVAESRDFNRKGTESDQKVTESRDFSGKVIRK